VYGEPDAVLRQNVPIITGFRLPSGQIVHPLNLPVYNPGNLVQFTVQGTFTRGADDSTAPSSPTDPETIYTWAQHQPNTPYSGYGDGYFSMTAPNPCDSDLHTYYFAVRYVSRTGLQDDWDFPIRVQGQGGCAAPPPPTKTRITDR
jgi:hypothetical protein